MEKLDTNNDAINRSSIYWAATIDLLKPTKQVVDFPQKWKKKQRKQPWWSLNPWARLCQSPFSCHKELIFFPLKPGTDSLKICDWWTFLHFWASLTICMEFCIMLDIKNDLNKWKQNLNSNSSVAVQQCCSACSWPQTFPPHLVWLTGYGKTVTARIKTWKQLTLGSVIPSSRKKEKKRKREHECRAFQRFGRKALGSSKKLRYWLLPRRTDFQENNDIFCVLRRRGKKRKEEAKGGRGERWWQRELKRLTGGVDEV